MIARHGVKLMLFAAGLLGAASSWAQAPAGNGPEGMGPMRGLERLHKELNLNAQQEELWKRAQGVQRDALADGTDRARKTARATMESVREALDLGYLEKFRGP